MCEDSQSSNSSVNESQMGGGGGRKKKRVEVSTAPDETSGDDKVALNLLFLKLSFQAKVPLRQV